MNLAWLVVVRKTLLSLRSPWIIVSGRPHALRHSKPSLAFCGQDRNQLALNSIEAIWSGGSQCLIEAQTCLETSIEVLHSLKRHSSQAQISEML